MKKLLLLLSFILAAAGQADAANRTVCNAGCEFTRAQLQNALNAAVDGDVVIIENGFTFSGTFTLPIHTGTSGITLRGGVSSTGTLTSTGSYPATGVRMTAALAASNNLPKLQSNTTNIAALRTADPSGGIGPHHWTVKWIELLWNNGAATGSGTIFQCGNDSNAVVTVNAEIPTNFTIDQVYAHGHAVMGQHRGMSLHCSNLTLSNSSILDIKSTDTSDGQAIFLNSYFNNVTIRNNDVQGGSEVILQGGSSGCCRTGSAVTAASSTTAFTIGGHTDLYVGQSISVEANGSQEEEVEVASCGTSTAGALCTSNSIVVTPALSQTPVVTADVDWGLVPDGLTITRNHIWRPASWRSPVVSTPQGVTAASSSSGTLAAGTYSYKVVAYMLIAGASSVQTARSGASSEVTYVRTTTGGVTISWTAVPNAAYYRVFGRDTGGENIYWQVTAPTTTYTDTNAAGTTLTVPTSSGTTFYVKNLLELKNGKNVLIEGNVIEYTWLAAQSGFTLTLTPANNGSGNDSTKLEDITVRNNIFRHGSGGIQMATRDVTSGTGTPSGRTRRVTVRNNLWYDINSSWGASVQSVIVTTRDSALFYPVSENLDGDTYEWSHNTFIHTSGSAMLWWDMFKTSAWHCVNCIWQNNIGYKLTQGLTGGNSCTQGNGCWTMFTTTSTYQNNVVCDATASSYPGGSGETWAPSCTTLQGDFTDFSNNNYILKTTSTYHNAATDGTDVGAIIPTITALTDIALSGNDTGSTPVVPPSIITALLPNGQVDARYSTTVTGTCPSTPCVWTQTGVPTGVTFTSVSSTTATLDGTPLSAGSAAIQLTLTDSGSLTAVRDFPITILDSPVDPNLPPDDHRADAYNFSEGVFYRRSTNPCIDNVDDTGTTIPKRPCRVGDVWSDTSTTPPVFKLLRALSPTGDWVDVTAGTVTTVGTVSMPFYTASSYTSWSTGTLSTTATELFSSGHRRLYIDLTGFTQCRVWSRVGTATGGGVAVTAYAQYATDLTTTGTVTWTNLGVSGNTPFVSLDTSATAVNVGAWANIATGAKTDVALRIVAATASGSATAGTPAVANTGITCK